VRGDRDMLEALLREDPSLAGARSARRHHATLLHYVAANGVEGWRQRTPPNAVDIARLLLDAGADPNALADMYDAKCTTLSMLVSSSPPADAGLQLALAELLVERGATLEAPGSPWNAAVVTSLAFGFLDTARAPRRARRAVCATSPSPPGSGCSATPRGCCRRPNRSACARPSRSRACTVSSASRSCCSMRGSIRASTIPRASRALHAAAPGGLVEPRADRPAARRARRALGRARSRLRRHTARLGGVRRAREIADYLRQRGGPSPAAAS
jgi:hypothetical protein